MNNRRANVGTLIWGAVAGILTGGLVVLFAAPRSGIETRQFVRERGNQMRDRTSQTFDKARVQAETRILQSLQRTESVVHRLEEQVADLMRRS
jgi:gas vesicle protein